MNNTLKLAAVSSAALMLAAAPAMAEGPTLKLGGFYDQKMSIADQDNSANVSGDPDVRNDVEIYFLGGVTLDNGIKIATRVELEGGTMGDGNPDSGNVPNSGNASFDQIDEAFMTISGSFGSVKIGQSDTAAKSMTTGLQGTWASNVGENMTFNTGKLFVTPALVTTTGVGSQMDLNSDGEQISYTTPSFAGFQIAAGYAANNEETHDGLTADGTVKSIFDVAARYMGKIGDVGFRVGGGYTQGHNQANGRDPSSLWMFGGSVRIASIQLAASYSQRNQVNTDSDGEASVISLEEVGTLELGVRAWMGPNQFSIAYNRTEADSPTVAVDGDELTVVALAMRRTLGKGVSWHNTLYYYDAEDANPTPAAGAVTSNDGWAFTTGIQLSF